MGDPLRPREHRVQWTDRDFDVMGWHDVKVHAVSFSEGPDHLGRLALDLDYIVDWVSPPEPGGRYRFWIGPATLVFDGVGAVRGGALDLRPGNFPMDIQALERSEPDRAGRREWTLEGHNFDPLVFSATGFRQYLRAAPVLSDAQALAHDQRGAPSFAEEYVP